VAALGTSGSGSLGYLSQTLSTTAGVGYLLSFWANNSYSDPAELLVSWNGTTLLDTTNLVATDWTNIQFFVSAAGPATALEIGFQDDYDWLGLDEISVTPTNTGVASTVPGVASFSLSGDNLVLTGTNGQSGWTYYVLATTNLALPLSQWTPVATNFLSASGNFTITATNSVSPKRSQQFYILKTQ